MYFQKAGTYSKQDVKNVRLSRGMTQSDLAAYLSVSPKTVESWETGTRNPSGSVCRLLDLLKTSDEILFSRACHYLDHHVFSVGEGRREAMWVDRKDSLAIFYPAEDRRELIMFPQNLPNDPSLQRYHDMAGRVVVKEYLMRREERERLLLYAEKLTKGK